MVPALQCAALARSPTTLLLRHRAREGLQSLCELPSGLVRQVGLVKE